MRLIGRGKIADLGRGDGKASKWLRAWASEVEHSQWATPSELQARYPSVVLLDVNTFRFDVGGVATLDVRFLFEQRIACILRLT
ncbi:MAG: type II toxin-antitoxin system HigB family toxin [Pseudomonadota bacterium]